MPAYKREHVEKPKDLHPIHKDYGRFGELKLQQDSGWVAKSLDGLHKEGNFFLSQLERIVLSINKNDYSELKESVAKKRIRDKVHPARIAILENLKKHIDKAKSDVAAAKNRILRETELPEEKDAMKMMQREIRLEGIRADFRRREPGKERTDFLKENAGNLLILQALVTAPDEIVNPGILEEVRREYAFRQDPSLQDMENDSILLYQAVRKRASEINSSSILMLNEAKLEDPIAPPEHFNTFMPDNEYELYFAEKILRKYQSEQAAIERRQKWEEHNKPTPGETGEAAKILAEQRRKEFDAARKQD